MQPRFGIFAALCVVSSVAYAGMFGPSNYWDCVLDEVPGSQNDAAARAVIRKCGSLFPDPEEKVEKKSGGIFGTTAEDCILERGKNTSGNLAPRLLANACFKLFPSVKQ